VTLEIRSEPLGGGALARLALAGGAPPAWYVAPPADARAWRAHADLVRAPFAQGDWLTSLAAAFGAGGLAAERLARTARDGGVVITTGQQPGLFGGPLYTWWKALSALTLADALEAAVGIPVAPVFWAATDDSDFGEASWTQVAVDGGVDTLRLSHPGVEGIPMARLRLGAEVASLAGRLARGAGSAPFARALDLARAAYEPGRTIGDAYVALVRGLLEPLGVAVLDASHDATQAAARPVLRRALERAPAIDEALRERVGDIEALGLRPQAPLVEGLSLVFAITPGGKQRIPLGAATGAAVEVQSGALSPNVLLRPIVERVLLPTVAYMAGPGEIAYFAQVSAVADALGEPPPLALPRWSGTIVEPRVRKILERYDIGLEELHEPHAVEGRLARAALPPAVEDALGEGRSAADRLAAALTAGDAPKLVPVAAVEGARRALLHRLERLERRYVAAAKRHEAVTMADVATARGALFPNGKRQERALNFIPLLARYGPALVDCVRERAAEHAAGLVGAKGTGRDAPLAHAR
jgi:bacillithiol synthase